MASPPSFSCGYASVGAASQVSSHLDTLTNFANVTLDAALTAASEIDVEIPETSVNVHMDELTFTPTAPGHVPDIDTVSMTNISVPEFDDPGVPGGPNLSTAPTRPSDPPLPTTIPAPDDYTPTFPDAPTIDLSDEAPEYVPVDNPVDVPEFYPIVLPPVPTLAEITFEGVRPSSVPAAPSTVFDFEEEAYSSTLMDAIKAKLLDIFANGSGLPAAAEAALRNRAYVEVDQQAAVAIDNATNGAAARGFSMPTGTQNSQIMQAQQNNQNLRAALSRDIYIKGVDTQLDQLKTALSTGIACEDVLIRLHISVQERKLNAARALMEAILGVFNAQIARHNAEIALYQADAEVFRDKTQAQLAEVQLYSEQVKAQGVVGEINDSLVRRYAEGFRAVEANANAYRAVVDGFRANTDAKRARVEVFTAQIQAELGKIDAAKLRLQIFAEKIRAEGLKQDNYKIRAETYSAAVQGWSSESQARIESYKGELAGVEAFVRTYLARLDAVKTQLEVERTRIAAVSANNEATLQAYQAETAATTAYNEASVREAAAEIQQNESVARLALQNAQINVENALNAINLVLRGKETSAQVYAQLASSSISAVHVNASISDSASASQSCGQSVSYSTEF